MKKLMSLFDKLAPHLVWFSQLKYIDIMQRAFITTMPVLLIGSTFLLVASFPVPAVKELVAPLNLGSVTTVTMDMFSLFLIMAVAYHTSESNDRRHNTNSNKIIVTIIAVSAFMLVIKPVWGDIAYMNPDTEAYEAAGQVGTWISATYLGTKGIMAAIVVGIASTELFEFLVRKKITIKMPDSVPPMVSQAFASIIPFFSVMTLWWFLAIFLGFNIPQFFLDIFKPFVAMGDSLGTVVGITFLNRALWMVGIHGSNVISGVTGPLLTTMSTENLAAFQAGEPLPYIASTYFYDVYVWVGFVPLSLVLITSKSKKFKVLGWLALGPAIFNIGEPLIFGIPIVLNPVLFIPFVLGYVFLGILSYILVSIDVLPQPVLSVMWTMPAPIKAYLSTNYDITATIYVLLEWVFLFCLFKPFIMFLDKQAVIEEAELEEQDGIDAEQIESAINEKIVDEKSKFKEKNAELKESAQKK